MAALVELLDAAELPVLLKIEEAARVLTIGRSLAYRLAHEYLASGGTSGLPVIRFGAACVYACPRRRRRSSL
jgi:hypothetical protein